MPCISVSVGQEGQVGVRSVQVCQLGDVRGNFMLLAVRQVFAWYSGRILGKALIHKREFVPPLLSPLP